MSGAMRLSRGLTVALVVVMVSASFHVLGGGCLDHLTSLGFALLTAATIGCAVALSSREWTLPRLFLVVAIAQVGFHLLFDGLDRFGERTSLIPSGHDHSHDPFTSAMLAMHVLAAVVVVLLLRRGERWILALADLLQSLLPRPIALIGSPTSSPTQTTPQAPKESGLRRILFTFFMTHRGPPFRRVATATA